MINQRIFLIQSLGKLEQPSGFMRTCSLEPLGMEYLESCLQEIGFNVNLLVGNINVDYLINEIIKLKPFALCFSVYTYQFDTSIKIVEKIQRRILEINYKPIIIFGGYHPSALPEEVLQNDNIDFVITGEGERTLQELLLNLYHNSEVDKIHGIYYKKENKIYKTKNRSRINDIDILPYPKRHKEILDNTGQYQITYPPPSEQISVAQVSFSRGCPYSCSFCSSENTWGKSVIWRDPIKVLDEVEYLYETYGTNLIYFPDLTFNVNEQKVIDICNEFIKRDLPVYWWGLFRLDRLNKKMLTKLKEAKCVKLSIGFESVDNEVAKEIKGDYQLVKSEYLEMLKFADELGLIIKAFLIIGFPHDTREKILHYNEELLELPVDEIRVTFITPFPGTRMWEDYKNSYLDFNNICWSDFTTEDPIIEHPILSNQELIDLRLKIVKEYYFSSAYITRINRKIKKHSYLNKSYLEYFEYLLEKRIFDKDEFDQFITSMIP